MQLRQREQHEVLNASNSWIVVCLCMHVHIILGSSKREREQRGDWAARSKITALPQNQRLPRQRERSRKTLYLIEQSQVVLRICANLQQWSTRGGLRHVLSTQMSLVLTNPFMQSNDKTQSQMRIFRLQIEIFQPSTTVLAIHLAVLCSGTLHLNSFRIPGSDPFWYDRWESLSASHSACGHVWAGACKHIGIHVKLHWELSCQRC